MQLLGVYWSAVLLYKSTGYILITTSSCMEVGTNAGGNLIYVSVQPHTHRNMFL